MGKKILIMGLPGAGKTTLASKLKLKINSDWINADQIRKDYNDLDFSTEGRIRQSLRMKKISNEITNTGKNVKSILDFLEGLANKSAPNVPPSVFVLSILINFVKSLE